MYEVTVHRVFSAGHAIRLYDGSLEPFHGHNWTVELCVAAAMLDDIEVVMDFHALEKAVDALILRVNNRSFNEIPPFADGSGGLNINPTAERIAWWFATEVAQQLPRNVELTCVRIGEAPGCVATYRP